MNDRPGLDDPIWDYILIQRLLPFIPRVRDWWLDIENFSMVDTGIVELEGDPPGLYVRFTRTAIRSPIRGVQAFPFIPTGRLQITGVQGGSTKMISRICIGNRIKIEEFTIVCKSNLPSTFNQGQIIAIVPTAILEDQSLGQWLYFTQEELEIIAKGKTNTAIQAKALLKI